MKSKNKPRMTRSEALHVERVAELPCIVCGSESGTEVHEPDQGSWFISIPLCVPCHRGPDGWHGTRLRWSLHKMDERTAINETLKRLAT